MVYFLTLILFCLYHIEFKNTEVILLLINLFCLLKAVFLNLKQNFNFKVNKT